VYRIIKKLLTRLLNLNSAVECGTYAQSFCPQRLVHGIRCTLQVHLHPCSNHCKQKHCTFVFTSTAESRLNLSETKSTIHWSGYFFIWDTICFWRLYKRIVSL